MASSVCSVELHGLNKLLTIAESQQLNEYLSRRRSELEEDRRRQLDELEAYEEYFRHAMDTVDTSSVEGQAQMQRIYQLWTRYRNSTDAFFRSGNVNGRASTSGPVSPAPATQNIQPAPRYPPGLFYEETPAYVPLSPLFDADPFAANPPPRPPRHDTNEFSYLESVTPSDVNFPIELEALLRSPSPESAPAYQHVAFYTHQHHQSPARILTDGYKNTLYSEPVADQILQPAFAQLLVEQTVRLLVEPGVYRAGQGGADEAVWGKAAVNFAELARAGRHIPSSAPWGRMGMDDIRQTARRPSTIPVRHHNRVRNPYHLSMDFLKRHGDSLHSSTYRLISQMRIPITSVVAAIWFLQGLPFHDGDGLSGHEFRQYFRESAKCDTRRMVKHAITLGLLLAGKWLDDNAYHNRTWSELSAISLPEIDRLEHLALGHYQYSLNLPGKAWFEHVNTQAELLEYRAYDKYNWTLITQMQQLCNAADESEARLADQIHWSHTLAAQGRAAMTGGSGASSSPSHYHDESERSQACGVCSAGLDADEDNGAEEVDFQLDCYHERYVSALVDEDDADLAAHDDDATSEFADYDGAKPFITQEHLRRSVSVSSSIMDAESSSMARGGSDEGASRTRSIPVTVPSQVHPLPPNYTQPWFGPDGSHVQGFEAYTRMLSSGDPSLQARENHPSTSGWPASLKNPAIGMSKGNTVHAGTWQFYPHARLSE